MPTFDVSTNVVVADKEAFLKEATKFVAKLTGKPESYICIKLADGLAMSFAGSTAPCADVRFTSLGTFSNDSKLKSYSAQIATLMEKSLGVPSDRFYVFFHDAPYSHLGYQGSTFG
ncbi:hypothetical protein HK102_002356 [Quaeritorhiza haematococci]|nr:hypothetical protein HK102_002356 [Quaeritorhiza haematococci]